MVRTLSLATLAFLSTTALAGPEDDTDVEHTVTTSDDREVTVQDFEVTIEEEVVIVNDDGTVKTGDLGLLETLGLSLEQFDLGFEVAVGKGADRQVLASVDLSDPENPDVSAPKGADVVVETSTKTPSLDELAEMGVPENVLEKLRENVGDALQMVTTVEVVAEVPDSAE